MGAKEELKRKKPNLKPKESIAIFCNAQNTEPSYFEHFQKKLRISNMRIFKGSCDPLQLVEKAEEKRKEFDQIWCVFDCDDFGPNFDNAIQKAKAKKIKIAYSNQAFEYWLLLHFEDHQGGKMNRNLYEKKLNEYLKKHNESYNRNEKTGKKIISPNFFEILYKNQIKAIERAKKILEHHDHQNSFAQKESSTTVFELVEALENSAKNCLF